MLVFTALWLGIPVLVLAVAFALWYVGWTTEPRRNEQNTAGWNYDHLCEVLDGHSVPAVVVNLQLFEKNASLFASKLRRAGKRLRVATKSVRVPELVYRVAEQCDGVFVGVMCYSVREIPLYTANERTCDILLAYPLVQAEELRLCWRYGTEVRRLKLTLMVDCAAHVRAIGLVWLRQSFRALREQSGARPVLARVCVDADMAYRPVAGVYVGARRSPCRTAADLDEILTAVAAVNRCWSEVWESGGEPTADLLTERCNAMAAEVWPEKRKMIGGPLMAVHGLMGYEAQVAGVPDDSVWNPIRNLAVRAMRRVSIGGIHRHRAAMCKHLRDRGADLQLVNGGGTGSVDSTCLDQCVTEVTVGSGLLQSRLFDFYRHCAQQPALVFVVRVTRRSRTCGVDIATCQSGGFIASGEIGRDKAPCVFLPHGYEEIPAEGFGEVQTPLRKCVRSAKTLEIGDLVFMRPSKAGEIAERFQHYLVVDGSFDLNVMKTYRGLGIAAY